MNSSAVLREMRELKESWRKQSFVFNKEQGARYSHLLELRRARVKEMLNNSKDK